ncbi:MAG: hypothetical protein AAGA53_02055 [Pseudomonadota bacterium]
MAQLIGLALIGGVLWYGYRALKREMERIGRETREAEQKASEAKRGKELVEGEDGVYRPNRTDDDSSPS